MNRNVILLTQFSQVYLLTNSNWNCHYYIILVCIHKSCIVYLEILCCAEVMDFHFFGHGKVMENQCWKSGGTLNTTLCSIQERWKTTEAVTPMGALRNCPRLLRIRISNRNIGRRSIHVGSSVIEWLWNAGRKESNFSTDLRNCTRTIWRITAYRKVTHCVFTRRRLVSWRWPKSTSRDPNRDSRAPNRQFTNCF